MKAIRRYAIAFAIGAGAVLLAELALFPLWFGLGWRKPIADWMVGIGLPTTIASKWGMVWVNLPNWAMALCAGLLSAAIHRRSQWLRMTLVTCASFMLVPHLLPLLAFGYHPWFAFGASTAARTFMWESVAIPLLFLGAWLVHRRQRPMGRVAVAPNQTGSQTA